LVGIIQNHHKNTKIAGCHNGYFNDDESVIDQINKAKPDIVFVGMGSPKQEKWIYANRKKLNTKLLMGVGGSFDVIAGTARLAPAFWRNNGFEFVYRLLTDPKRIKRQIIFPKFLLLLLLTRTKLRWIL
jgi:N-acetylglucosaminyldiphosphoundecaprenol N-acetyl-beta-D-mannosaminyltransferase